jgi:beta-glucosidase
MDGNPTYTKNDLTRASQEDIQACDYVLVGMTGAYRASYSSYLTAAFGPPTEPEGEEVYYPASLQYAEYTADAAADPSLSGQIIDGEKENRSYKGVTAPADANYGHLEALQYAAEAAGDVPVIASVSMERGMIWTDVEPLCDVILVSYNAQKADAVAKIILGEAEPQGLLVFQQPISMEAVEGSLSDVPRDLECYVDAAGNAYDFAFGMNWGGVIDDARTQKYSAEPLTKVTSTDLSALIGGTAEAAEAVTEDAEETAEAETEAAEEMTEAAEAVTEAEAATEAK